jgi:hypothetical protein
MTNKEPVATVLSTYGCKAMPITQVLWIRDLPPINLRIKAVFFGLMGP